MLLGATRITLQEQIILLSAVAMVGVVATAGGGVVLRRAWCVVRRKPGRPNRRWLRLTERVVVGVLVVGLACLGYARFIEPGWLEVTRVTVETDKLTGSADPIRIVHISDLHCDPEPGLVADLPERIAGLDPDVICFTGDALNSVAGLEHFRKCMTDLVDVAPTYAVWGNWEPRFNHVDLYGGTGVEVLHDRFVTLEVRGQRVNIAGVRHQADLTRGLRRAMDGLDTSDPTVLLCHIPSIILALPEAGVDLCLSGHIHGGQVALPFYGALITLSPTGKRFERGLYEHEGTNLYVSRGIGMEGSSAPRLRFFARPEVTLIELRPRP